MLNNAEFDRDLKDVTGTVYITSLGGDLKNVVVEVKWKSGGGTREVTMALTTDITRNGVNRQ